MELDWFLKVSKGKSIDEKVNDLTELMFKLMESFVNVVESIDNKLNNLGDKIASVEESIKLDKARQEGEMNTIKTWLKSLEGRAVTPTGGGLTPTTVTAAPAPKPVAPPAPPKPKPVPPSPSSEPLTGMGARAAIQSELKDLFAKMKKE